MNDNVENCCFREVCGVLFKRICSVVLCAVIVFVGVYTAKDTAFALTGQGYVDHSDVAIRADATTNSECRKRVSYVYVTVTGQKRGTDNSSYIWYAVTYGDISGYIREDLITVTYPEPTPTPTPTPEFSAQLAAFPESYKPFLTALHAKYPNWVFLADNLAMSYTEAVDGETANWKTKLVNMGSDGISWRAMTDGAYNWDDNTWNNESGNWTAASREVVMYYMDIRNFLNERDIYMFLKQGYSTSETEAGVAEIVKGTFLANGYNDPEDTAFGGSYIKVIMEAARQSGVSAYVLAATLRLEQGVVGDSALISGTTSYGKYFNFFNVQASGDDVVGNGLAYAKNQGWTTRSAAIIGGAQFYAKGYISSGQDTYFYKNFDLLDAPYYGHQYAQSIYDQRSSASLIRDNYSENYTAPLIFRIPVYTSISETVAEKPVENGNRNNYYIMSATNVPNFSKYNFSYAFSVSGDTEISVGLHGGATITTPKTNTLSAGVNIIKITVKAETGYTRDYTLNITAAAPCVVTVPQGTDTGDGGGQVIDPSTVKKGDTNGDGKVDVMDFAAVRMHLLEVKTLEAAAFAAADTNGDGKVDVMDFAAIRMHLLEIKSLY